MVQHTGEMTTNKIWRVAVLGAKGRMGSEAVRAVNTAADMDLVAALGSADPLTKLLDVKADVIIDLTVPTATEANVRFAVEHGIHAVVGTTGWDEERLSSLKQLLGEHPGVTSLSARFSPPNLRPKPPGILNRLKSLKSTTQIKWMHPPAPPHTPPGKWLPPEKQPG